MPQVKHMARKNTDVPMRLRRRQSDAKWRANVASCFETLKHIIPFNKRASKRQISKALVLQETAKHISFLESILQTLMFEKAKLDGQKEVDDCCFSLMQQVKVEFAEKQERKIEEVNGQGKYRRNRYKLLISDIIKSSPEKDESNSQTVHTSSNVGTAMKAKTIKSRVTKSKGKDKGKIKRRAGLKAAKEIHKQLLSVASQRKDQLALAVNTYSTQSRRGQNQKYLTALEENSHQTEQTVPFASYTSATDDATGGADEDQAAQVPCGVADENKENVPEQLVTEQESALNSDVMYYKKTDVNLQEVPNPQEDKTLSFKPGCTSRSSTVSEGCQRFIIKFCSSSEDQSLASPEEENLRNELMKGDLPEMVPPCTPYKSSDGVLSSQAASPGFTVVRLPPTTSLPRTPPDQVHHTKGLWPGVSDVYAPDAGEFDGDEETQSLLCFEDINLIWEDDEDPMQARSSVKKTRIPQAPRKRQGTKRKKCCAQKKKKTKFDEEAEVPSTPCKLSSPRPLEIRTNEAKVQRKTECRVSPKCRKALSQLYDTEEPAWSANGTVPSDKTVPADLPATDNEGYLWFYEQMIKEMKPRMTSKAETGRQQYLVTSIIYQMWLNLSEEQRNTSRTLATIEKQGKHTQKPSPQNTLTTPCRGTFGFFKTGDYAYPQDSNQSRDSLHLDHMQFDLNATDEATIIDDDDDWQKESPLLSQASPFVCPRESLVPEVHLLPDDDGLHFHTLGDASLFVTDPVPLPYAEQGCLLSPSMPDKLQTLQELLA